MIYISKSKKGEFGVLGAIFLILILNSIIYFGLSLNETHLSILPEVLKISSVIGLFFTALSIVLIIVGKWKWIKYFFFSLLFSMTLQVIINLYHLIVDPNISQNGIVILLDAFMIWMSSLLVFSLWYWLIDRGGPIARDAAGSETRYDLLFPQYQSKIPGWDDFKPKFLDYIFFSFFTSTGFSPADTLPLTKRVKFIMMVEASISLVIIGMVAARAISLIQ